jgi:hypothetical protein
MHLVYGAHGTHRLALGVDALPYLSFLHTFTSSELFVSPEDSATYAHATADLSLPSPSDIIGRLQDALLARDTDAVDAAAVVAIQAEPSATLVLAFEWACRDLGRNHNMIFADHVSRASELFAGAYRTDLVRSFFRSMTGETVCEPDRLRCINTSTELWEINREVAETLPTTWSMGVADDGATWEMLTTLRDLDPLAASELAHEQLRAGVGLASLLDAVSLSAAEALLIDSGVNQGLAGNHSLTTALGYRSGLSQIGDDSVRRLLVLQMCANAARSRPGGANASLAPDGLLWDTRIDGLQPIPDGSVEATFELLATDRIAAASMALGLATDQDLRSGLLDRMWRSCFESADKPDRVHDLKFNEAAVRTAEVVQPQFAPLLVAACISNSHATNALAWSGLEEARELLRL